MPKFSTHLLEVTAESVRNDGSFWMASWSEHCLKTQVNRGGMETWKYFYLPKYYVEYAHLDCVVHWWPHSQITSEVGAGKVGLLLGQVKVQPVCDQLLHAPGAGWKGATRYSYLSR